MVLEKTSQKKRKISWLTIISIGLGLLVLAIDVGNFIGVIPFLLGTSGLGYSVEEVTRICMAVPLSMGVLSVPIALIAVIRTSRREYLRNWLNWSLVGLAISVLAYIGSWVVIFGWLLSEAL